MTTKPCDKCKSAERIAGERYCKACRKAVIDEIRQRSHEEMSVRTLFRRGTEEIGRSMHIQPSLDDGALQPEPDDAVKSAWPSK